MNQFLREINDINSAIESFNNHLATNFRIPGFDFTNAIEDKYLVKIIHGNWDAFPFPNNATGGVYFVFGHETVKTDRTGLYIGKASFGSMTSSRLYAHLHPHRSKEHFTMNNCGGEVYILDYIAWIDLDRLHIPFMAPALEEFLISTLRTKINLLNGTGNS